MDESVFLHTSLDSSDSFPLERRPSAEGNISPYFLKSMTQSVYEVALRQKDGELASYMSRWVWKILFVVVALAKIFYLNL